VSVDAASTFGKKTLAGKTRLPWRAHHIETREQVPCGPARVTWTNWRVMMNWYGVRPLLQVCCCGPGRQETSIDRCSSRCTVDAISVDWSIGATTAEKLEGTSRGVDTDPIPFSSSIPSPFPTVAPPLFHPFPSLLTGWDAPCIPRMLHGMERFFSPPR